MERGKRTIVGLAGSLAICLAAATLAPVAGAQARGSVERTGTGRPACGLGKDFHAERRAALRERVKKGLLVFRGLPDVRGFLTFRQDKVFWYLTGVESRDAALIMDAKSGREVLFLPGRNLQKESWDGECWDSEDEWVKELTGFDEVLPISELGAALKKMMRREKTVWVSTEPFVRREEGHDTAGPFDKRRANDPFDGRMTREQALWSVLEDDYRAKVKDVTPILSEMRRIKTAPEIEAMRRAGHAGALAMAEAMRSTSPGIGEWNLEAVMTFIMVQEGAAGPAYHAIVGSGSNANVLHYNANWREMRGGEVVLIDFGPEVDHYTTDITRTWPVGGEFTPEMAKIYDAVLAAQKAGIAAVKPGATIRDVDAACSAVLRDRGFGPNIRHGACHYIGLEVHDVGSKDAALEPGVAFTVEPGAYDDEAGIGVRIEDVVVVTEDGCEVLTGEVPKERAAIEALIREQGVLDWVDARGE